MYTLVCHQRSCSFVVYQMYVLPPEACGESRTKGCMRRLLMKKKQHMQSNLIQLVGYLGEDKRLVVADTVLLDSLVHLVRAQYIDNLHRSTVSCYHHNCIVELRQTSILSK